MNNLRPMGVAGVCWLTGGMSVALGLSLAFLSDHVRLMAQLHWRTLILFVVCYLAAHAFRFCRLRVLLMTSGLSTPELLTAYLQYSWISIALPFKIGELFRWFYFSRFTGGAARGFILLLVDRVCDGLVLLVMILVLMLGGGGTIEGMRVLAAVLAVMVLLVWIAAISLPSIIDNGEKAVILYSHSRRALVYMRVLALLREMYRNFAALLKGRVVVLLGLSLGIWLAEVAAFLFLVGVDAGGDYRRFMVHIQSLLVGGHGADATNLTQQYLAVAIFTVLGLLAVIRGRRSFRPEWHKKQYNLAQHEENLSGL